MYYRLRQKRDPDTDQKLGAEADREQKQDAQMSYSIGSGIRTAIVTRPCHLLEARFGRSWPSGADWAARNYRRGDRRVCGWTYVPFFR
jgi:hypothetical protein